MAQTGRRGTLDSGLWKTKGHRAESDLGRSGSREVLPSAGEETWCLASGSSCQRA